MSYRSKGRMLGVFYTPGFPPGVKWLLISNVAIFLLGFFLGLAGWDRSMALLVLQPAEVLTKLYIWQLATYMFLHGGFTHILWNMLALWMFGADLERLWGTRRFLNFYFFCGIGAGICVVVLNYLLPSGNPHSGTIGASGAIFGILLANAVLFPDRTILWGFLIPIKMKWFVLIIGTVTFISSYQANTGVSEFANLGGLLFGYIFLKKPRAGFDFLGPAQKQYKQWKIQRAKKKFAVYMKKQTSNRDPWVH
jgi:membrane associated rhomboid family serine protease